MYCPHCRYQVADYVNHCPMCGSVIPKIASMPVVPSPQRTPVQAPQEAPEQEEKGFGTINVLLIILLILNVFCTGVIITSVLMREPDREEPSSFDYIVETRASKTTTTTTTTITTTITTTTATTATTAAPTLQIQDSVIDGVAIVFDLKMGMSSAEAQAVMESLSYYKDGQTPIIVSDDNNPNIFYYVYYFTSIWYRISGDYMFDDQPIRVSLRFENDRLTRYYYYVGCTDYDGKTTFTYHLSQDEINTILNNFYNKFAVIMMKEPEMTEGVNDNMKYVKYDFSTDDSRDFLLYSWINPDTDTGYVAIYLAAD